MQLQLLICPEAEADLHAYRLGRDPRLLVRILRGTRCAVLDRCMGEWGAAMQLPYCFEGTWDSLEQCLSDLPWVQGRPLLLLITSANRLLPRSSSDVLAMIAVLSRFADSGRPQSLDLLLHVEPRHADDFTARLQRLGVAYTLSTT